MIMHLFELIVYVFKNLIKFELVHNIHHISNKMTLKFRIERVAWIT